MLQIWGMAAKSNIKKIENLQSIILRTVLEAQWYVRNDDIKKSYNFYHQRRNTKARKDTSTQIQKSQETPGKRLLLPTTQKTEKETLARPH